MPYNINDPQNYYCLADFDEENNTWACVSRSLLNINENTIEFAFPFPGIYAIIFSPISYLKSEEITCNFLCKYRKTFIMTILILIPIIYLTINYLINVYGDYFDKKG